MRKAEGMGGAPCVTEAREVLAATATGSSVMANLATGFTRISDAHSVASSPCQMSKIPFTI